MVLEAIGQLKEIAIYKSKIEYHFRVERHSMRGFALL